MRNETGKIESFEVDCGLYFKINAFQEGKYPVQTEDCLIVHFCNTKLLDKGRVGSDNLLY